MATAAEPSSDRANQKRRTRKDLLQAASRLMKQGVKPDLEAIAEEAMVSRATAYRYFPGVEALLLEAALDMAAPEPAEVLRDAPADDPVARLHRVDTALLSFTTRASAMPYADSSAVDFEREVMGGDMQAVAHVQPMCRCPIASYA